MLWICYYKWIAHYRWTLLHVSVDQCFLAYLAPGFQLILSFYLHPCLLVHPCLLEICFSASQETHTQCITEAINIAERGGHSDARTTSITLCLIRSLEKALPMQSCQFECFFFLSSWLVFGFIMHGKLGKYTRAGLPWYDWHNMHCWILQFSFTNIADWHYELTDSAVSAGLCCHMKLSFLWYVWVLFLLLYWVLLRKGVALAFFFFFVVVHISMMHA